VKNILASSTKNISFMNQDLVPYSLNQKDMDFQTCDKENVHSAKIIQKNGGKLDSEIENDNKIVQRYWIRKR